MSEAREIRCSFCLKTRDEAGKIVAGPTVFICDQCAALCHEMMSDPSFDAAADPLRSRTYAEFKADLETQKAPPPAER